MTERPRQRTPEVRLPQAVHPAAAGGRGFGHLPVLPGGRARDPQAQEPQAGHWHQGSHPRGARSNASSSLDFVDDQMAHGRRFRSHNVVHDIIHQCLAAIPDVQAAGQQEHLLRRSLDAFTSARPTRRRSPRLVALSPRERSVRSPSGVRAIGTSVSTVRPCSSARKATFPTA